jgi:hypothetical protein
MMGRRARMGIMDEVNRGINIINPEEELVREVMFLELTRRSIKIRTLRVIMRIMRLIGIPGI